MHGNFKNNQFLVKSLHIYCTAVFVMAFSTRFILDAKVKSSAFWHISNLELCCKSESRNIYFKSKYTEQGKIKVSEPSEKWKCVKNIWQKIVNKFKKLSLWNILELIFCDLFAQMPKIWILSGWPGIRHQIQAFQVFPWDFIIPHGPQS